MFDGAGQPFSIDEVDGIAGILLAGDDFETARVRFGEFVKEPPKVRCLDESLRRAPDTIVHA